MTEKRFMVEDWRDTDSCMNASVIDTQKELASAKFRAYENALDFCNYLNYTERVKKNEIKYHKRVNELLSDNFNLELVNNFLIKKLAKKLEGDENK